MNGYADFVKNFFKVEILRLPNTKTYNFQMSNNKFRAFTKFIFTNDIEKILQNIKNYLLLSKFL